MKSPLPLLSLSASTVNIPPPVVTSALVPLRVTPSLAVRLIGAFAVLMASATFTVCPENETEPLLPLMVSLTLIVSIPVTETLAPLNPVRL